MALKHILVPVDFNVPSRAALRVAAELAAPLGASIDVLHVVDLPGRGFAEEGYVPVGEDYRRQVHDEVTKRLHEWIATTSAPAGVSQHVVDGRPKTDIVRYAADERIDLIVMGTHGRGGMARLVTGSVAEHVVRAAPCPVLTVRGAAQA